MRAARRALGLRQKIATVSGSEDEEPAKAAGPYAKARGAGKADASMRRVAWTCDAVTVDPEAVATERMTIGLKVQHESA